MPVGAVTGARPVSRHGAPNRSGAATDRGSRSDLLRDRGRDGYGGVHPAHRRDPARHQSKPPTLSVSGPAAGTDPKSPGAHSGVAPVADAEALVGLCNGILIDAVRHLGRHHRRLDYGTARHFLFSRVDNHGGRVFDVYGGRTIATRDIPEADGPNGVNTEHTRPRSTGVRGTAAECDLHHLFPTDTETNAQRGSLPFGVVARVVWSKGASKLGYAADGRTVFEPPDAHKGNVARALFYVSATYGLHLPDDEEAVLKRWNHDDPVDDAERERNRVVAEVQGNRNPFVDRPELADRIDDF